jgi:hypothetical protein
MSENLSTTELEAFLDEALPIEQMAAIEDALRHSDALQKQLAAINGRRDAGVHSLGEIWRRRRLSCPTREKLGSFLLGVLPRDAADHTKFHLEIIGCRYCAASITDLKAQQSAAEADIAQRRRQKYFQSSAGYLRRK